MEERLELITYSDQDMSDADIGRKTGVSRSTVSTILMAKAKILKEIKKLRASTH